MTISMEMMAVTLNVGIRSKRASVTQPVCRAHVGEMGVTQHPRNERADDQADQDRHRRHEAMKEPLNRYNES
jgi:hypothetical protein